MNSTNEPSAPQEPNNEGRHRRDRRRRQPAGPGTSPQTGRRPEPALNMEELTELVSLITAHGLTEFELERDGFRVRVCRNTGTTARAETPVAPVEVPAPVAPVVTAPVPHTPPHPGAQAEKAASADEDLHIIHSPIIGTFYRAASPTAEPFVKTGSRVNADTVVCIIEAMKMMNEILAESSGEIIKIYVDNAQPVEYGQPLFGVRK